MEEEKIDILLTNSLLKQNGEVLLRHQSSCGSEPEFSELKQINGSTKSLSSNGVKANKPEWVRLNVGGQYFVTTKTTLVKVHMHVTWHGR